MASGTLLFSSAITKVITHGQIKSNFKVFSTCYTTFILILQPPKEHFKETHTQGMHDRGTSVISYLLSMN